VPISGFDFGGDAVVLGAGEDAAAAEFVGAFVGAAGDDAIRGGGIDTGEGFELIFGRVVDVDGAVLPESVVNALRDGLSVLGRFGGCVGGALTNLVGSFGRRPASGEAEQTDCEEGCHFHGGLDAGCTVLVAGFFQSHSSQRMASTPTRENRARWGPRLNGAP
jgi:hypothetical protein